MDIFYGTQSYFNYPDDDKISDTVKNLLIAVVIIYSHREVFDDNDKSESYIKTAKNLTTYGDARLLIQECEKNLKILCYRNIHNNNKLTIQKT